MVECGSVRCYPAGRYKGAGQEAGVFGTVRIGKTDAVVRKERPSVNKGGEI